MSYLNLTIKQLHTLYVEGKTTPALVLEEVIASLEQDKHNILEATMYEEARKAAKALGAVEKDNLLWGVPFLVKDNLSTKGIITSGSSNLLCDYVPLFDATVISRLVAQKAIPVAKVTLDELGMGGSGKTGHKGVTTNPYGKGEKREVGGSSSGSASGVASGYVPFALGSDTGDSIRKPASYAGLVGFKPTWGTISRYGLYSFTPSLDHIGFLTRSVFDAALLFDVVGGNDELDLTTTTKQLEKVVPNLTRNIKGKKFAVIKELIDQFEDQDIIKTFNELLVKLTKEGAVIETINVDINVLNAIFPTYFVISCAEAVSNNANLSGIIFGNGKKGDTYEDIMMNTRRDGFGLQVKSRFIMGNYFLKKENRPTHYDRALKTRNVIVKTFTEILKKYDAVLLPATPIVAPLIDEVRKSTNEIAVNHLAVSNLGGFPSVTLPLGFKQGLPFGINVTSEPYRDAGLLNIAWNIEQLTGYYNVSAGDTL